MRFKKIISILIISSCLITSFFTTAFADSANVVTLGADLSDVQKDKMLQYFGVNKNNVIILEVTNAEERKYLEGIATDSQIGTKTYSCSYVQPTNTGGIKVKTANLTWVTSSMIASTLATSGMGSCNVVVASLFPVSGTGGLTGIMKAFEDATGEKLDETKKELACEELITTSELADNIGQDKATGIINDVKTEIIKNNTSDKTVIAETINNVTNNYNITLTSDQQEQITSLMSKIAKQNYDYSEMKDTLKNVSGNVRDNLKTLGEKVKSSSLFASFKISISNFFNSFFKNDDLGILENTNDNMLGDNTIINATESDAVKNSTDDNSSWFKKLFSTKKGSKNNYSSEEIISPESEKKEFFNEENNLDNE